MHRLKDIIDNGKLNLLISSKYIGQIPSRAVKTIKTHFNQFIQLHNYNLLVIICVGGCTRYDYYDINTLCTSCLTF